MDLLQLQNHAKRDPESYKDEFMVQLHHFESNLEIFALQPQTDSETFISLVNFISHVAPSYPKETAKFPTQIMKLLETHLNTLHPNVRRCLIKCLILLRNRDFITAKDVIPILFNLFRVKDKAIRKTIFTHIINDVKKINIKKTNVTVNKTLQNFMYKMLDNDDDPMLTKKAVDILIDLYRRNIWNDERTVNVISAACTSKHTKTMVASIKFFLGIDKEVVEDEEDAQSNFMSVELQKKQNKVTKKTKKRKRLMDKLSDQVKKSKKRMEKGDTFSAIKLLNNAQGFAEKLLATLKRTQERFEVKMMLMMLISRLISSHELMLLNFYSFIVKYLQPHIKNVTQILVVAAQSVHALVPPDVIETLVKCVADNFVNDHSSPEAVTIGLNTIREICARQPMAMTSDMLSDLVEYKRYRNTRNKGVVMAARSLLQLFRTVNPAVLHRKERGKFADMDAKPRTYGEIQASTSVSGVDLLEEYQKLLNATGGENEGEDKEMEEGDGWEICEMSEDEEEDDDDEGWIDVDNSSDDEDGEGEKSEENGTEKSEGKEEPKEEETQKEPVLDKTRILTPKDFELINKLKAKKEMEQITDKVQNRKRKRDTTESESTYLDDMLAEEKLLQNIKRSKRSKEEKIEAMKAGREDREKFGAKEKDKKGGTSNKEKQKHKPFMLTKWSQQIMGKKRLTKREQKNRKAITDKRSLKFQIKVRR